MKKEELEYHIKKYVDELIDNIMPANGFIGKVENATAKYWVEQNEWRLDDILSAFVDENECINERELIEKYEGILFENGELRVSIKEVVPDKYKNMLPDKVVLFRKEDLHRLVGIE